MDLSTIINSDLMLDSNREVPTPKAFIVNVPLIMTVDVKSEAEMGMEDIFERVGDIIANLCELAYKSRTTSDIVNLKIDMQSKIDITAVD